MARNLPAPPKRPCGSCPYRKDVPSGVWAAEEYQKLPLYDGDIGDQLASGAIGLFMCHQRDGCLCGGWLATHGPDNLLALRMQPVDAAAHDYVSDVPVFASGAEAAAHGLACIKKPPASAQRLMAKLTNLKKGT